MKKLSILLPLLLVLSCKKEQSFNPEPNSNILLMTIEYVLPNKSWTEAYTYNNDNQLIQVEDAEHSKRRNELVYNEQDQLTAIKTYNLSNFELILRIDLEYNEQDQLIKTLNYSIYEGQEFPVVYEYEYDEKGFPSQQLSYIPDNKDASSHIEKYTWKNGNVVKVATYDNEETLRHEFFYEYDDGFNYTSFQRHHVNQFNIWNRNNIIHSSYKDYTGLIDTSCNPCISNYTYNEEDYPIAIEINSGTIYKLIYQ